MKPQFELDVVLKLTLKFELTIEFPFRLKIYKNLQLAIKFRLSPDLRFDQE